ncbi:response regulator transcription factor [Psychrobacillus lasiicapitis]|uniref:Response regulator transcription factor n=1 Tax=Psychrobacillus lasiicapitis TaxID=1636719 RepID=A0A544THW7_9BACI|nr:response regulator transcription factor [Psychrobacillus lasiicapitis]
MLTALGDVPDRLHGLQNGADDYMSKPFVAEEVVALVQAVLRMPTRILSETDALQYGKLRIHQDHSGTSWRGIPYRDTAFDLCHQYGWHGSFPAGRSRKAKWPADKYTPRLPFRKNRSEVRPEWGNGIRHQCTN